MSERKTVKFEGPNGNDPVTVEVSNSVDEEGDRMWRIEKYYVVRESELESLLAAAYADGVDGSTNVAETHLAACRAREVVEDISGGWMEVGKR